MIHYKITMEDNFTKEDFERATNAVVEKYGNKEYKIRFTRDKENITIHFKSSLHVVLLYLEYLLESEIQLDLENKIVQNKVPTDVELISVFND